MMGAHRGKLWKKVLAPAAAVLLAIGPLAAEAEAEPYTYRVVFHAGGQGLFTNSDSLSIDKAEGNTAETKVQLQGSRLVVTGLEQGDNVSFNAQGAVELTGGKYYVKGVRKSGRDNDDAAALPYMNVEGDMDYVVAYGIHGKLVAYTVTYTDAEGNELYPAQTYYGNIGDKPVVAYRYIDGYEPQALGITRTLTENEAQNVFPFIYTPVVTPAPPEPGTGGGAGAEGTGAAGGAGTGATGGAGTGAATGGAGTGAAGGAAAGGAGAGGAGTGAAAGGAGAAGTGAAAGGAGAGAAGGAAAGGAEAGAAGEAGAAEAAGAGAEAAGEAGAAEAAGAGTEEETAGIEAPETVGVPEEEVPLADQGLLDLDEEETPRGNIQLSEEQVEEVKKGLPLAAGIGMGAAAGAALVVMAVLLKKRLGKKA